MKIKLFEQFNIQTTLSSDEIRYGVDLHKYNLGGQLFGTPCGHPPKCNYGLSSESIAEFIDVFFGGEMTNLEMYEEDGYMLVAGGTPELKKLTITNQEFNHFCSFISDQGEFIDFLSDFLEVKGYKFNDVEKNIKQEDHPEIICMLFAFLVEETGCSFRVDHMGNGKIDLESE